MATESISEQVGEFVLAAGVSRYRICREVGLDQATMSRFVRGKGGLSLPILDRLGAYLGLEITARLPARRPDEEESPR